MASLNMNTPIYFAFENKNQPRLAGNRRQVSQCRLLLSLILDIHRVLTYFTLTVLFCDYCSSPSSSSYAMNLPFHL